MDFGDRQDRNKTQDRATEEQRDFRQRLGHAVWALLEEKELLPGLSERKTYLKKLWEWKIHPYGKEEDKGAPDKKPSATGRCKGRWYKAFAGDVDVAKANVAAIACKIHEHLYHEALRLEGKPKRTGLIEARAQSIASNVPKPAAPAYGGGDGSFWTQQDREDYAAAGDVAKEVLKAAKTLESKNKRVTIRVAGKALYEHYARLFRGHDGTPLRVGDINAKIKIKDIEENKPVEDKERWERWARLLALHNAVKDCYARILKHHKKDEKDRPRKNGEKEKQERKVSQILPQDMGALFALVEKKGLNRDLNALVRLGKIIHYESARGGEDTPADVVTHWPTQDAVKRSAYWTSDGQAKIKRNEAFVRVWRHVLALASRTLTDWADPENRHGSDILLAGRASLDRLFDSEAYRRKAGLLFGAELFKDAGNQAFEKQVIWEAKEGTAQLRHSSFHFKGLGGFADILRTLGQNVDEDILGAIQNLWEADVSRRSERLKETMHAADFEYFFKEWQCCKLFEALSVAEIGEIPLPRFGRMLLNAFNDWKGQDRLGLPKPANRAERADKPASMG